MNKVSNIAIIGLGQIGIYLYNELRIKKTEIEKRTGKKLRLLLYQQKIKKKKKISDKKKFSIKIHFKFLKMKKLIFYLNVLDYQMVFQKNS